jgi:hypothetical protein
VHDTRVDVERCAAGRTGSTASGNEAPHPSCSRCGVPAGKHRGMDHKYRFPFGMNADDHAEDCDIRTSRDGWDARCTCGVLW